jgi:hypothetical protein
MTYHQACNLNLNTRNIETETRRFSSKVIRSSDFSPIAVGFLQFCLEKHLCAAFQMPVAGIFVVGIVKALRGGVT